MPLQRDVIASRTFVPAPAEARWAHRLAPPLLCAVLLSLAGCGDEAVFTKLFTSEHFDYYVEERGTPPCDGTAQWLERYYNANAKFLGATLPPGERIQYYSARSKEGLAKCGFEAAGCALDTTIYSLLPVYAHEIVHANASLLQQAPANASDIRHPPALFTEGLAVVLGCGNTTDNDGPLDTSDPIETLVETKAFYGRIEAHGFGGLYGTSGSFVLFLIDKFGSSPFLSFYARAPREGSRKEIDAVFHAELGVSLDEAFADWRKEPPQYFGDLCLRLMECDPSMPSLTDTIAHIRAINSRGSSVTNRVPSRHAFFNS